MSRRDSDEFFYEVTSRIPGAAKGKQAVPKVAGFLKKPEAGAPTQRKAASRSVPSGRSGRNGAGSKEVGRLLDEETRMVEQRIAELKAKSAREKRAKEKRDQFKNFIPPPEHRYHASMGGMPHAGRNRREELEERNHHALRFLMLFAIVCGLLWWLLHSTAA
ncbi:MAG: hypothetical protein AB7I98_13205 [Verrucomicrobiales bacterium]|nr:hypothetical protein [Verrucomicrobiae bacterium]MCP5554783.1 hypothetical protein [Akkermansiaceae bacterium]